MQVNRYVVIFCSKNVLDIQLISGHRRYDQSKIHIHNDDENKENFDPKIGCLAVADNIL